jgi:chromosome segregation ATPase
MNIGVGAGGEEISQKNAEIASLTQRLSDRQRQIVDLEKTIQDLSAGKGLGAETELLKKDLSGAQQKVRDLEAQLAEAMTRAGGDANLQKELASVTSERNEIRERLKEYAIIEEDLANLKRLQQENDQLKAELAALKKGAPAPAAAPVAPPPPVEEVEDLEAAMAQAIADSKPAAPAAAVAEKAPQVMDIPLEDVPQEEGEQKSAEELLSEFEKMLG